MLTLNFSFGECRRSSERPKPSSRIGTPSTLENVETDLKRIMEEFWSDEKLRTCKSTGSVIQKPKEAVVPPRE